MELLVDHRIGFTIDRPALAVPQNHVAASDILKHRATDLARISPLSFAVHILGAQADVGRMQGLAQLPQINSRWTYRDVHIRDSSQGLDQALNQAQRLTPIEIHFPIASDE